MPELAVISNNRVTLLVIVVDRAGTRLTFPISLRPSLSSSSCYRQPSEGSYLIL